MGNMSDIIGQNPLAQSLQSRGLPLSILSQMSPAASNFQPDLQVPPNSPLPNGSPMSAMGAMPVQNTPGVPPMQAQAHTMVHNANSPKPMSEAESIVNVKLLGERLQLLNKHEDSKKIEKERKKTRSELMQAEMTATSNQQGNEYPLKRFLG